MGSNLQALTTRTNSDGNENESWNEMNEIIKKIDYFRSPERQTAEKGEAKVAKFSLSRANNLKCKPEKKNFYFSPIVFMLCNNEILHEEIKIVCNRFRFRRTANASLTVELCHIVIIGIDNSSCAYASSARVFNFAWLASMSIRRLLMIIDLIVWK